MVRSHLEAPCRRPFALQDVQADLARVKVHVRMKHFVDESDAGRRQGILRAHLDSHLVNREVRVPGTLQGQQQRRLARDFIQLSYLKHATFVRAVGRTMNVRRPTLNVVLRGTQRRKGTTKPRKGSSEVLKTSTTSLGINPISGSSSAFRIADISRFNLFRQGVAILVEISSFPKAQFSR